jgi:starch synthase
MNGIDAHEWDPSTDPHLPAHFDAADLEGKALCKAALQREAGLPVRPDLPLFGLVGRLVAQKGVDVLAAALERILRWDLQLILLGTGDPALERFFVDVARTRSDRFAAWIHFDEGRAHRIEAGADFFLMPSRFEPSGLNQMYSLRYGTLPIVRATGGLVDTVENYGEVTGGGTGFVFGDLTPASLGDTVGWALSTWYHRPAHVDAMRRRAMDLDNSWERAAERYEDLYRTAIARRGR